MLRYLLAFLALGSASHGAQDQVPFTASLPFMQDEYFSQYAQDRVLRCQASTLTPDLVSLLSNRMDVWTHRLQPHRPFDVRVSRPIEDAALLKSMGCACEVWIHNVPLLLWQEQTQNQFYKTKTSINEATSLKGQDFFKEYHSFDELVAFVRQLAEQNPDRARFVPSIGKSHEGRSIPALHISENIQDEKAVQNKTVIWFNGGIHAREWISSHTAVFLIHQLLTSNSSSVHSFIKHFEIVVAPHINPDGYEYSRSSSRLWRKNRRKNKDFSYGVDLNRNFDIQWSRGGSSSFPSSETYRGPSAASEPETKAMQAYIGRLKERAVVGWDLHSYGQLIMRPYGNSMDDHPTEPWNKKLGDGMRDVIAEASGTEYTSQKSAGLYPVSGGFDDWMTSQGLIGFTMELRDTGRYGFVLPKEFIIPTGEEIWKAFQFMCQMVLDDPRPAFSL